jgi:hypothetical protein
MNHRTLMGILTVTALGILSATVCKSSAKAQAMDSSTAFGLSFTAVPSAFYVRQGDQLRQVVLVSCRPDGVREGVLPESVP